MARPDDPRRRPAPVKAEVAAAARFLLAAANSAVTAPTPVGVNRTVTVQDLPGPKLVPEQVSAVTLNAVDPNTWTVSELDARPPVLASVNTRSGFSPTATCP